MLQKSDKLKNWELELADLKRWLDLGLVPKENIKNHKIEIDSLKKKIKDESVKLSALKDTGEVEEYVAPKKTQAKPSYSEGMCISDEGARGAEPEPFVEAGPESERTVLGIEDIEEDKTAKTTESDDVFGGRNRWTDDILDPDSDEW